MKCRAAFKASCSLRGNMPFGAITGKKQLGGSFWPTPGPRGPEASAWRPVRWLASARSSAGPIGASADSSCVTGEVRNRNHAREGKVTYPLFSDGRQGTTDNGPDRPGGPRRVPWRKLTPLYNIRRFTDFVNAPRPYLHITRSEHDIRNGFNYFSKSLFWRHSHRQKRHNRSHRNVIPRTMPSRQSAVAAHD